MKSRSLDASLLTSISAATTPTVKVPVRVDDRPDQFSTTTTVATTAVFVWDVNGYYALLGVPTNATRAEIREAYQRLGGQSSPRLTEVAATLLNTSTRRLYDSALPGQVWVDQEIRAIVSTRTRKQSGTPIPEPMLGALAEVLDNTVSPGEDAAQSPLGWEWGYWRLGSDATDEGRLRWWQALLVDECSRRHLQMSLSVGFVAGDGFEVLSVGHRVLALLGEDEQPTARLAALAVDQVSTPTSTN